MLLSFQKPTFGLKSAHASISVPALPFNLWRKTSLTRVWQETLPPVDLTSFLSITGADMMRATDAAEALHAVVGGGGGAGHVVQKTWTTVVQTDSPELRLGDL